MTNLTGKITVSLLIVGLARVSTIAVLTGGENKAGSSNSPDSTFVRPGHGSRDNLPIWGHRSGLRIGLKPTPGPAGLIRIYAPYLKQEYPQVVNFLSIEPSVQGRAGRGQSELEASRDRPGQRGLTFWASNRMSAHPRPVDPVAGLLDDDAQTLRLFIHTEPFRNGAHPVVECIFRRDLPFEVELTTHAAADSVPMKSCVISATMGNYGLLRRIHLKDDRTVSALDLWKDERPGRMGFLTWRAWPAHELNRTPDGRFLVELSTDTSDPAAVENDPNVRPNWRYIGDKATHYWRTEANARPTVAVNGRRTYWMSQSPIPGGASFENFELRMPFRSGRRMWFGVRPSPNQDSTVDRDQTCPAK